MISKNSFNDLILKKGYVNGFKINKKESNILKYLIFSKINKKLKKNVINQKNFKNYHLLINERFHNNFFSKLENRTFNLSDFKIFKKLSIKKKLTEFFGKNKFQNLYKIRSKVPEINFRIIRPTERKITSAHKDDWFYICNKIKKNKELYYIKCWMPLIFEKNKNGLSYVPGSLNKTYNFKILKRKNKTSIPIINSNYKLKKKNFNINQNQFIFFSNNLLHLSLIGGKFTRVSVEFELGVFKKNIQIK